MTDLTLYNYSKSSAAYRVRIALNLKGLTATYANVNLLENAQRSDDYLMKNPAGLVPALSIGENMLSQSLAIIEYLDEAHPDILLLPGDAIARAKIRAFALAIACDIHPILNLRVLNHLRTNLNSDDGGVKAWYAHWINTGLSAIEEMLRREGNSGKFCFGDTPTLADVCLAPQVFNAKRWSCPIDQFERINEVMVACDGHPAFIAAHPEAPQ